MRLPAKRARVVMIGVVALGLAAASFTWSGKHNTEREIRRFRAELEWHLTDPMSAIYKHDVVTGEGNERAYCGLVNAKNSFGGYTGFRMFWVTGSKVEIQSEEPLKNLDADAFLAESDLLMRIGTHCDAAFAAIE